MVISVILMITKIVGFLKLRMIAGYFETSRDLDIFWAASLIPDMIFNILIAGSINAAIIPVFSEVMQKKGERKLVKLFALTTFFITLLFLLASTIAYIYAEPLAGFMAQKDIFHLLGTGADGLSTYEIQSLVKLTRILLLSPLLLSVSALISGFLQVHKKFFITSIAPFIYNLSVVLGVVAYHRYTGLEPTTTTLAWAIVVASALHLFTQMPLVLSFMRRHLKIRDFSAINGKSNFYLKEVLRITRLAIPRILAISGEYINLTINTIRGLSLVEGALSANKYAVSLYALPGQIFASAIAQVALPNLSDLYAKEDFDGFKKAFNRALRWTLFIMFPAAVTLLVLRLPIVRIVYGTGEFGWWSTIVTSWALALLSGAVIGQAVVALTMRAFFAMKETWIPLIATAISIVVNLFVTYYAINFFSHYLDWRPILTQIGHQVSSGIGEGGAAGLWETLMSFVRDLGVWMTTRNQYDAAVGGLSVGLTATFLTEMVFGIYFLQRKMKLFNWKETWHPILDMFFATIAAGFAMYGAYRLFEMLLDTSYVANLFITFFGSLGAGGVVYVLYAWFMDMNEIVEIWSFIKKLPVIRKVFK